MNDSKNRQEESTATILAEMRGLISTLGTDMCWVKGAVSKIEGKVDGLSDRVAAGYVTKEIFASLEKDVGENKNSIKKIEGMFTGLLVKVLGGVVTLLIGAYVAFREFVSK